MEFADAEWPPLAPEGRKAAVVPYQPQSWEAEVVYVVMRQKYEGQQEMLEPRSTVILTSRADLPLPEVVQRHRGMQGQENAQKGPRPPESVRTPIPGGSRRIRRGPGRRTHESMVLRLWYGRAMMKRQIQAAHGCAWRVHGQMKQGGIVNAGSGA